MAVRRRRISVRTRVRLARLTSARWRDCSARFKTDFFFFLTLVACPWAIYCSFCAFLKPLTVNEAYCFVKRAESRPSRPNGARDANGAARFGKSRRETGGSGSRAKQTRRTVPAGQFAPPHHHRGNHRRRAHRPIALRRRHATRRASLYLERHHRPGEDERSSAL